MPGPPPKSAAQRRRRNRSSTAVTLVAPAKPTQFPIDISSYCPQVQAWFHDIAKSAMASEWDMSDIHGLVIQAELRQAFFTLPPEKVTQRVLLATEIRLGCVEYGLSPLARRRLQWEIERGEAAEAKTTARRTAVAAPKRADPRLKAV